MYLETLFLETNNMRLSSLSHLCEKYGLGFYQQI